MFVHHVTVCTVSYTYDHRFNIIAIMVNRLTNAGPYVPRGCGTLRYHANIHR